MKEFKRRVYLVERHDDDIGYDEVVGYVVIADTATEARKFGTESNQGDQNPEVWEYPTTKATVIGYTDKAKGIILVDYKAG